MEIANNVEINPLAARNGQAPLRAAQGYGVDESGEGRTGSSALGAIVALVALVLIGGFLSLFASGAAEWLEVRIAAREGLLSVLFLAEAATAIICFAVIVRWLKN